MISNRLILGSFKCTSIFLSFLLLGITFATFESALAQKQKSKLNANIYEKESSETSFSAKVKVLRDMAETEVFFEGIKNSGPYLLNSASPNFGLYKNRLEKSKKANGPMVNVVVDNDLIKSVQIEESKERNPASEKQILDSILKN